MAHQSKQCSAHRCEQNKLIFGIRAFCKMGNGPDKIHGNFTFYLRSGFNSTSIIDSFATASLRRNLKSLSLLCIYQRLPTEYIAHHRRWQMHCDIAATGSMAPFVTNPPFVMSQLRLENNYRLLIGDFQNANTRWISKCPCDRSNGRMKWTERNPTNIKWNKTTEKRRKEKKLNEASEIVKKKKQKKILQKRANNDFAH